MASRLRTPTLALAGLSLCLCLAIVGTAGRSLNVWSLQHKSNAWLLPVWPNHFDIRELETLIGTAATIAVLNAVLAVAVLMPALPANGIVFGSAFLSTLISIVSVSFTTVINYRAPTKDTLKTWTCRWTDTEIAFGQRAPAQFQGLCHKTRFAYYSTVPVLVLQVLLLTLAICTIFARPHERGGRHQDLEKGRGHQLQDIKHTQRQQVSFDARSESPRSYQDSARILGVKN